MHALRSDVTQVEEANALADLAIAELGGIDILINIVGGYSTKKSPDSSILEMSEDRWDDTMNLNLKPNIYLMKKLVPGMIEQDYGRIVNIASVNMQGLGNGRGITPDYDAAKAAVASFTRSTARDFARRSTNVLVNCIAPGLIRTRVAIQLVSEDSPGAKWFADRSILPRMGEATEIADAALWLASAECSYMTGEVLRISGGFTAAL